jgi:hypothetical protein
MSLATTAARSLPTPTRRRLDSANRTDKVWGEPEIAAVLSVASPEIKLALVLAIWTSQRQGDLLRLPWSSTFHDLRGSAVVRLALAEATVPQIATFTGHSLRDVEAILDAHCLGRDIQLAEAALLKLEKRTTLQNEV